MNGESQMVIHYAWHSNLKGDKFSYWDNLSLQDENKDLYCLNYLVVNPYKIVLQC